MKRLLPFLHPILFAIAPVLSLYASNEGELEFDRIRPILEASAAGAALAMLLLSLVFRSFAKGALVASLLVLQFFLYGHVFDLLSRRFGIRRFADAHVAVTILFALLLVAGAVGVWRSRGGLGEITRALSVAALALLAMSLARLAVRAAESNAAASKPYAAAAIPRVAKPPTRALEHGGPTVGSPDVYYLILDGYARQDVLWEIFDHDNREFLAGLERRGFYVASESLANYPTTHLSLASSLNLDYLDDVPRHEGESVASRLPYFRMIQAPLAGRIFQSHGYRFVHFATNWGGTETSALADEVVTFVPEWLRGELAAVLVRTTALRSLEPNLGDVYSSMFRALEGMANYGRPKFVFVHFTLPHNPYVFDDSGRIRTDIPLELQARRKTGGWPNRRGYVGQLRFVNRRITEVIDRLLAGSGPKPVILLQSDHGSATRIHAHATDAERAAFFRERFGILNALLVPDAMRAQLDPQVAPVNSFRLLFNQLFAAQYELLPSRQYFSWYNSDGPMHDVTEFFALPSAPSSPPAVQPR